MSEQTIEAIADAMINHFKATVAASADLPFEETKVTLPQRSVWIGYAKAVFDEVLS